MSLHHGEPSSLASSCIPYLFGTAGKRFVLHEGKNIIGRCAVPDNDVLFINLDSPRGVVSRFHAQIIIAPNGDAWVEDYGSTNGTFLNVKEGVGVRLEPKHFYQLTHGNRLTFGDEEHFFLLGPLDSSVPDPVAASAPAPVLRLDPDEEVALRCEAIRSIVQQIADAPPPALAAAPAVASMKGSQDALAAKVCEGAEGSFIGTVSSDSFPHHILQASVEAANSGMARVAVTAAQEVTININDNANGAHSAPAQSTANAADGMLRTTHHAATENVASTLIPAGVKDEVVPPPPQVNAQPPEATGATYSAKKPRPKRGANHKRARDENEPEPDGGNGIAPPTSGTRRKTALEKANESEESPKKHPRSEMPNVAATHGASSPRIQWELVKACLSGMGSEMKAKLSRQIEAHGGSVVDDWEDGVNMLVVLDSPANRTPKLITAVGTGITVVTCAFFETKNADTADFVPDIESATGQRVSAKRIAATIHECKGKPALHGMKFFLKKLSAAMREMVRSVVVGCGGTVSTSPKDGIVLQKGDLDELFTSILCSRPPRL